MHLLRLRLLSLLLTLVVGLGLASFAGAHPGSEPAARLQALGLPPGALCGTVGEQGGPQAPCVAGLCGICAAADGGGPVLAAPLRLEVRAVPGLPVAAAPRVSRWLTGPESRGPPAA